jgi:hypothetical protein
MRIRLSDGRCEVEVEADEGTSQALEATALRLFHEARADGEGAPRRFGFAHQLDGVSLDSQSERAEEYEDHRFEDDE